MATAMFARMLEGLRQTT